MILIISKLGNDYEILCKINVFLQGFDKDFLYFGKIDWDEFWEVVNGNGFCNKERIDNHINAHKEKSSGGTHYSTMVLILIIEMLLH